jgi:glycosyl transferase family 87
VTPRAAAGALVAATVGAVVAATAVSTGRPILASRWSLLLVLGLWGVLWLAGVAAALRTPPRTAVVVILLGAAALRLAAVAGPPTTSDDLYRYSWDGRVQAAGVDPYAASPAAAVLRPLREPWLWPDGRACAALHRSPGCTRINRPTARTIYPPLAEAWFSAVYRIGGIRSRHKSWQVAGLVTEAATLGLLAAGLRRWQRDVRWLALYALSPVPVLEIVNNGHVDGLAVTFLAAVLVVARRRSSWWRDVAVGTLVGAAALVKFYPAVALVGMVSARRTHRVAGAVRASSAAAVVTAAAYAPHVRRVGPKVLGYLPGYLSEEHYRTGTRFLLAALLRVPADRAGLLSLVALGAVAAWAWRRRLSPPAGAAVVLGTALLVTSPVQPWYAVALLAVATVAGWPAWAAVAAAGYPYFFAVILADPHAAGIGQLSYAGALGTIVAAAALAGRRSRSHGAEHQAHVPHRPHRAAERPGHLRPAFAGVIGHGHLVDGPAGRGGAEHHLEWPAEPAVGQLERRQGVATCGPHGPEVGEAPA